LAFTPERISFARLLTMQKRTDSSFDCLRAVKTLSSSSREKDLTVTLFEKPSRTNPSIESLNPLAKGRRALMGGLAAACAGLTGSALAPKSLQAMHATAAPPPACGRSKVIASDEATVVETNAGKLRGFKRGGIYAFKGVPYGASTAGALRFMPPAKPEPWAGIRNALAYGRTCPQEDSVHYNMDGKNLARSDEDAFLLHRGSAVWIPGEDCLRLNVWTPEINGSHKRPVMVSMHGGGFFGGCGHEFLSYDGENLARNHDVVLVNHNHRLNIFGYLNLASIGGDEFAGSSNVGMLDIVAVLQWVRANIASFGGDPDNVTILGQSGGGGKVATLMAMPAAKGLFHRAIVQSGPYMKAQSPEFAQQVAGLVLDQLGLSRSQVKALQTLPVDRISWAAAEAMKKIPRTRPALLDGFGTSGWGPTADGIVLPHHPFEPESLAISSSVPMITGTALNESVSGIDRPDPDSMTEEDMHQRLHETYGDKTDAIVAAYKKEYPKATTFRLFATISTANWRILSMEQASRKAALGAAPAYAYIYSWKTPVLNGRPGPFHGADLVFTYDNAELCDHYSAGDPGAYALSKQMSATWVQFARTGDPNHSGLPHWPTFSADKRPLLIFDAPCELRNDPEGEALKLIAQSQPA
jgi:para-nitrobenzyl esterase